MTAFSSKVRRLGRWKTLLVLFAVAGLGALVAVLLVAGEEKQERAGVGESGRRAPLAPLLLPARRPERPSERQEVEEARPSQLTFISPRTLQVGSPARALAEFMAAWNARQFERMVIWTVPSWRRSVNEPARALRQRFGERRLRGYRIAASRMQGTQARLVVTVEYRTLVSPILRGQALTFVLKRENRQGQAVTRGGVWGIDPSATWTAFRY
jgi:hypothetical protein